MSIELVMLSNPFFKVLTPFVPTSDSIQAEMTMYLEPGSSQPAVVWQLGLGWVERIMLYNFGIGRKESEVAQLCLTLCNPMGHRLPGSSIHGSFQARVLEWVAISFSMGSSWPRDGTQVSRIVGRRFTVWATREVLGLEESLISSLVQVPQMGRVPVFPAPDSHRVEIGPIRLCTT